MRGGQWSRSGRPGNATPRRPPSPAPPSPGRPARLGFAGRSRLPMLWPRLPVTVAVRAVCACACPSVAAQASAQSSALASSFLSFSTIGRTVSPQGFRRHRTDVASTGSHPALSTTKVSGTPYTPLVRCRPGRRCPTPWRHTGCRACPARRPRRPACPCSSVRRPGHRWSLQSRVISGCSTRPRAHRSPKTLSTHTLPFRSCIASSDRARQAAQV